MTPTGSPAVAPPLTRAAVAAPAPPVRIVHMGLGAFHRAHQAWYTARSADADAWGIAAFTGRSPQAAEELSAQGGLYTLIERGDDEDRAVIVPSISAALDGADMTAFRAHVSAPATAVVTLTVTEPGYHLRPDGEIDLDDPAVAADIRGLSAEPASAAPTTAPGRLLAGLEARRRGGAGPIAVVPCDNIPANGALVHRALTSLAGEVDPGLARWIEETVAFVSTSVDRITPRTTDADRAAAAALTGYADAAPVVTEPFSDWVLSGEFPAGRPEWESAGARIVADIAPFEQRKLRLLNGAHSLLAYLGILRGHGTVAEAIADRGCRSAVEGFWAEARRGMPPALGAEDYCAALTARFANPRIAHHLRQIGMEGVSKLAVRVTPVARQERAAGRSAAGCVVPLAAWTALATRGRLPADAHADAVRRAAHADDPAAALIALLDAELAADAPLIDRIRRCAAELGGRQSTERNPH
ncbi:mannitol dehydrogenase family protein [Tomitella gaofuii]|uniref:mannitol dehydrogenase family protein n=1 Tax=Tomitella gaofuii TaxID=2760083 RepID=UPI002E2AEB0E|nr:mannitol dehydrogenase family protein [Tomitella gaofuii]